ncbi:hypothetical protein BU26DRAFT_147214 [Trematosphaeria pertusa]|uniref:Uncharacterized protein n=1 Tax=Trematosphaeria pertusa TaxID=390896 RepID=A0A6A6IY84_9PLEO|nr:uncharacterized protein BU26DRAFT_147214 [Trematosphaeria pertusa]KAF2254882.1 hypothetical protein BU26DRAFT_147214 [Trematosphaeria pertusa]
MGLGKVGACLGLGDCCSPLPRRMSPAYSSDVPLSVVRFYLAGIAKRLLFNIQDGCLFMSRMQAGRCDGTVHSRYRTLEDAGSRPVQVHRRIFILFLFPSHIKISWSNCSRICVCRVLKCIRGAELSLMKARTLRTSHLSRREASLIALLEAANPRQAN